MVNEPTWKTFLWRTTLAASFLVFFVALFYGVENSRGLATWRAAQQRLRAKGEFLDWSRCIPPPVPAESNFFGAPGMTQFFVRGATNLSGYSLSSLSGNRQTTENIITAASASNYLAWTALSSRQLKLIAEALQRPNARIDGDYQHPDRIPIANFVAYRTVCQVLAHQAKCHLCLNQPELALNDATQLYQLSQTLVRDNPYPMLVNGMVHVAITSLYAEMVAYGLDGHIWQEAQLKILDAQMAG